MLRRGEARHIGAGQTGGMSAVRCPVMVGRDAERELLCRALDRAAAACGSLVVVVGEAGVGKSRMVREITALAGQSGMLVLSGRAVAGSDSTPYRPFTEAILGGLRTGRPLADEAMAPWLAAVSPIVPPKLTGATAVGPVDSSPAIRGEGVLRVIAALSANRGGVLALEDLHWADPDTLDLLRYIGDNVGSLCSQSEGWIQTSGVGFVTAQCRAATAFLSRIYRDHADGLARPAPSTQSPDQHFCVHTRSLKTLRHHNHRPLRRQHRFESGWGCSRRGRSGTEPLICPGIAISVASPRNTRRSGDRRRRCARPVLKRLDSVVPGGTSRAADRLDAKHVKRPRRRPWRRITGPNRERRLWSCARSWRLAVALTASIWDGSIRTRPQRWSTRAPPVLPLTSWAGWWARLTGCRCWWRSCSRHQACRHRLRCQSPHDWPGSTATKGLSLKRPLCWAGFSIGGSSGRCPGTHPTWSIGPCEPGLLLNYSKSMATGFCSATPSPAMPCSPVSLPTAGRRWR